MTKTSRNFFQVSNSKKCASAGGQRIKTVKELGATSVETNQGAEVRRVVNDQTHCEVRDWLITRLLIDNNRRSGVAANLTVSEFEEAVFYPGTEEDLARWRMLVEEHKTAENYGAAVVWVYDDLYKLMDMYVRTVRSQFIESDPEVKQLFVSSNGVPWLLQRYQLFRGKALWRKEEYLLQYLGSHLPQACMFISPTKMSISLP